MKLLNWILNYFTFQQIYLTLFIMGCYCSYKIGFSYGKKSIDKFIGNLIKGKRFIYKNVIYKIEKEKDIHE